MFRFYNTKTDFEGDTHYRVNPENLQSQLENGYLFVDMMCHGWKQQWGFLDNWSNYMVSQAQELQNKGYTFITTISCYVNCFDTKPDSLCLGEGFMLNKIAMCWPLWVIVARVGIRETTRLTARCRCSKSFILA